MRNLRASRRGFLLPLILVVIVMLTLGGYVYTESMMIDLESTRAFANQTQSRVAADSGVEYLATIVSDPANWSDQGLYHRPDIFRGIALSRTAADEASAGFTIAVPNIVDSPAFPVRFGLANESGKLNLNRILAQEERYKKNYADSFGFEESAENADQFRSSAAERLLAIPGMDPHLADAVLDWIDADETARPFGAESRDYESMGKPGPKNGPLYSIDELLHVKGVTRDLVFGEDRNRNGLLDPGEDSNGDGEFQRGWSAYLTAKSRESQLRPDGRPKIDLNQESLVQLYDDVQAIFGEPAARFVVAYRMTGPLHKDFENAETFVVHAQTSPAESSPESTRGGMDLSFGGDFEIFSVFELIDSKVEAEIDGGFQILESPWQVANLSEVYFPLIDNFRIGSTPLARIHLFEARRETLRTVPGLTESVIDVVLSEKRVATNGDYFEDIPAFESTPAWLLTQGLVDLPTMRKLDHYLTGGGTVFRCQVVGFAKQSGPVTRLEILVDTAGGLMKLLRHTDFTDLGRGYPRRWMTQ